MHQATFFVVPLLIVLSIANASSTARSENSLIRLVRAAAAKKQGISFLAKRLYNEVSFHRLPL